MGNCFSDPSGPSKKGGQVLGSGPAQPASASGPSTTGGGGGGRVGAAGSQNGRPPQPLGGGVSEMGRERERALAAAEERAKAVSPPIVLHIRPGTLPLLRYPHTCLSRRSMFDVRRSMVLVVDLDTGDWGAVWDKG